LNRVGGETKFTDRNEEAFALADFRMKVYIHFCFGECFSYCRRLDSG
jgi:hypothetical protein